MLALHLRTKRKLEFWQVNKNIEQPDWVITAFHNGGFCWNGERSITIKNVGGLLKITVPTGDILVFNGKYLKAVPQRKFNQEYRVVE